MPVPYIVHKAMLQGDVMEAYDRLEPLVRDERILDALPDIHAHLKRAMDELFEARCKIDAL